MEPRRAHLNLAESSRQLFELDSASEVEVAPGWIFGAGSANHPVISNMAFRIDDGIDAAETIAAAREFFSARGRGFSVWGRSGIAEDDDLFAAAEATGLQDVLRDAGDGVARAGRGTPAPTRCRAAQAGNGRAGS